MLRMNEPHGEGEGTSDGRLSCTRSASAYARHHGIELTSYGLILGLI